MDAVALLTDSYRYKHYPWIRKTLDYILTPSAQFALSNIGPPQPSQDPRCAGLAQHFQGVQVGYGGLQNLGVSATNIPKIIMDSLHCLRTFQLANVPKEVIVSAARRVRGQHRSTYRGL